MQQQDGGGFPKGKGGPIAFHPIHSPAGPGVQAPPLVLGIPALMAS
jgi:hypothetical protein